MPGLVAPLVAFALGVVFALHARAGAERYDDLERRAAVRIVLLFGALVLAPVTAYFVAFAGDWSLGYLAEAQRGEHGERRRAGLRRSDRHGAQRPRVERERDAERERDERSDQARHRARA